MTQFKALAFVFVLPVSILLLPNLTIAQSQFESTQEQETEKPAEAKPADTKPADAKPAEAKPADTKPVDAKPAEAKPADAKPADVKPADVKPADAKPAEIKTATVKPAVKTFVEQLPFQGEYVGNIKRGARFQMVGLQLVARADSGYVAMMYVGGLPGRKWNGKERYEFTGTIGEGNKIELTSKSIAYQIKQPNPNQTRFQILTKDNQEIGSFYKIRRASPTLGASAPATAKKLFVGGTVDGLKNAKQNENGTLQPGFLTEDSYQDFLLHVEFRTPFEPKYLGQKRGNSGIYIQRRYEVQILDSFGLISKPNDCGSLYRQRPPATNMSYPPGQWQTYDIRFSPTKWNGDKKVANAKITVFHNGYPIHDDVEIVTKTGAGQKEGPEAKPILFQNHSNPVEYKNIWIVETPRWKTTREYIGKAEKSNLVEYRINPRPKDPIYSHVRGASPFITQPTSGSASNLIPQPEPSLQNNVRPKAGLRFVPGMTIPSN